MWPLVGERTFSNFQWQSLATVGTEEIFLFDYELGDEQNKYDPDLSCRFIYPLGPGLLATGKTWRIYPRITIPDLRQRNFPEQLIAAGITSRTLEVRVLKPRPLWRWNDSEAFSRIQTLNLRVKVLNP